MVRSGVPPVAKRFEWLDPRAKTPLGQEIGRDDLHGHLTLDNVGSLRETMPKQPFLAVSPEVSDTLASGSAVVALESTIITHGMPYPQNLQMAGEVEAIVRAAGATPATVALMDGQVRVGLASADLQQLAETGMRAAKASRRDVAALLTSRATAGTTVATTMQAADMSGIQLFATGGIGGVHRGAELSFDISADLEELSRTPVAVVCAGAKAILDLPKTLEVLETKGVPVIGYGTDDFPAFWTRSSGLKADRRLDTPEAVADLLETHFSLGLGGVLIGNPIPDADAMDPAYISMMIERALKDADAAGVSGKATTPYLLKRIFELTEGKSLVSNIALVKNNARVAAEIAVALAARRRDE
jgi:pseudouridine-5'-phosphate glycosidase